jgi:hypothetical protein
VSKARLWRGWLAGLLCACALAGMAAPAAQGAASDPLFIFTPTPPSPPAPPLPPPLGFLEGPCGLGVDPLGRFYVSDYYHDTVDAYDQNANYNAKGVNGSTGYLGQLSGIDPIDGPCGLAFDAAGHLYVNDYHRAVKRYGALGSFGVPTTITGATAPEETHPTGVAVDPASGDVYVDQRDHVSVFDASGAAVMTGLPGSEVPLQIGKDSLQDGYGIALSSYPGTEGRLYVPDAANNTIEVYDTATPQAGPVDVIDGSETPSGKFVSLRDASVTVDRVTGEIYVVDDLQPKDTESPQAIVDVFNPDGTYEGHLKFLVTWGMPSGLAVDNSATATQGRVYVTSGNSAFGAIYAYGPSAATTAAIALPSAAQPPAEPAATQGEGAPAGSGAVAVTQPKESFSAPAVEAIPAPASAKRRSAKAPRKAKAHHHKPHKKHRAHPDRSKRVR